MGHDNFEVEDALRNGWVEICYQPKIDLKRKCLIGAETLARLRHPRFGVMLPGSLFPGPRRGRHVASRRGPAQLD